jgi:hypothetical protein
MLWSLVGEAEGEVDPLTLAQVVEGQVDTGLRLRVRILVVGRLLKLP